MRIALALATLLAACGPSSSTTPSTTPEPATRDDSAVKEGREWTRTSPNHWSWNSDHDTPIENALAAIPGARGVQWMQLPEGAKRGKLAAISVAYVSEGPATWHVYATQSHVQTPTGEPLGTIQVNVTADQVSSQDGEQKWIRTEVTPPIEIAGSPDLGHDTWFLVYDGDTSKAAVASHNGEDASQVRYQAPGETESQDTPFLAHIRVEVIDVE